MRSASAQSKMADIHYVKNKLGDRMIKQLPNSFIAKYLDLCLADQLFASTDKSQYFAELRSMNCQKSDKDNDINDDNVNDKSQVLGPPRRSVVTLRAEVFNP